MTKILQTREITDELDEAKLSISRKVFLGAGLGVFVAASLAALGYVRHEANQGVRKYSLAELANLSDSDKAQLVQAGDQIRLDNICVNPVQTMHYEETTMSMPPFRKTTAMVRAIFELSDTDHPEQPLLAAYEEGDVMTVPIAVDNTGVRLAPTPDTPMSILGTLTRDDGENAHVPQGYYLQLISAFKEK